jgi:hypothetical protein
MKLVKKTSGKVGEITAKIGNVVTMAAIAAGTVATGGAFGAVAGGAEAGLAGAAQGAVKGAGRGANMLYKFAKGDYNKEPGLKGLASNLTRKAAFSEIKGATGGMISPAGIESYIKKSQKENQTNLDLQAEKGIKAAQDKEKQLKNMEESVKAEAAERMKNESISSEKDQATKERDQNKANLSQAQKEHDEAQRNAALAVGSANESAMADKAKIAGENIQKVSEALSASEQKLTQFTENYKKREVEIQESIAKSLGTTMTELGQNIGKATDNIGAERMKTYQHANEIQTAGFIKRFTRSGLFTQEDANKAADRARSIAKGKLKAGKKDAKELLKEVLEETGEIKGGGEEKSEKPAGGEGESKKGEK